MRLALGISLPDLQMRVGSGVSLLPAPAAPTLTLVSGAGDNTPNLELDPGIDPLLVGDVIRVRYSTDAGFAGASEITNTVDAAEALAQQLDFATGALADALWYFDARIERPGHLPSNRSAAISETIDTTAPTITSASTANVAENTTAVLTVTATDAGSGLAATPYSITGGADQAKFTINSTSGALVFASAPDFETPTDVGANNVYNVTVGATDVAGNTGTMAIAVTVTDVVEASTTTFNPSAKSSHITLSGGNLIATSGAGSGNGTNVMSVASHSTGKFYHEVTYTTAVSSGNAAAGWVDSAFTTDGAFLGGDAHSAGLYSDGSFFGRVSGGAPAGAYVAGDVLCFAADIGAGLYWIRINGGNWNNNGSADPASGVGGVLINPTGTILAAVELDISGGVFTVNFGGSAYAHAAPTGFGNW